MDNRAVDPIPTPLCCSTREDTIRGSHPCRLPGAGSGQKLKERSRGLRAQEQHQHRQFWSGSSQELVAKGPGQRAGEE